jgi:hypothetical protein
MWTDWMMKVGYSVQHRHPGEMTEGRQRDKEHNADEALSNEGYSTCTKHAKMRPRTCAQDRCGGKQRTPAEQDMMANNAPTHLRLAPSRHKSVYSPGTIACNTEPKC